MHKGEKTRKQKMVFLLSILSVLISIIVLVTVSLSWFFTKRELDTLTWIKTPIVLSIGSGNDHSIVQLDMGNIDVENNSSVDYVFCVHGEPVDIYSLQLAYTTNIAFYYDIYRADMTNDSEGAVTSIYTSEDGEEHKEYFQKVDDAVISGKPLDKMTSDEKAEHQKHSLSYGLNDGNSVDENQVQRNAEPLYWIASENGLNAMNPRNIIRSAEKTYFCDYYILHISWEKDTVVNDKETDMIYLTASK